MRVMRTIGWAGLLALAIAVPLRAAPAPVDQLIAELRGEAPAVARSERARRAVYAQVVSALAARLRASDAGQQQQAAQSLEAICVHASRPGAEPERAAVCRAMLAHLGTKNPATVRVPLLMQLERIGRGECVATAARLLADPVPVVRERALRVLQANPDPAAAKALRAALARAKDPQTQVGLILALGFRRDAESVGALARRLESGSARVALAAAQALGSIGGAEAAQALAAARVPQEVQAAVDDARARCAATLAPAEAEPVYLALAAKHQPASSRALGLLGLVAVRSSRALDVLLDCLQSGHPRLEQAAAQACATIRDDGLAARVLALYPNLSVPTQVAVLSALADRGDTAALPIAVQALDSPEPTVHAAALEAIGILGGPGAVPPLAQVAASGSRSDRQTARGYLAQLRGADTERALLEIAEKGAPQVRAALMGVLADRKMEAARPILVRAANEPDADIAAEAAAALGRIGGTDEVPVLSGLLLETGDEGVREAAQEALVAVVRRAGNPDQVVGPLLAGLPTAPVPGRCAALAALGEIGGSRALAELVQATASPEPEVKRAAVTALAESWEDTRPFPVLWNIARSDAEDSGVRVRALRGCLRLLGMDAPAKPDEVTARVAEILTFAQRPEEKRLAINVLRDCRVPAAVALAAQCLDDPVLAQEAADAILYLAAPRKKGELVQPAVVGPATTAAVARVRQQRGDTLPAEWSAMDVGDVGSRGSTAYADGRFTVKASGWDVWGVADGFHFVCQLLSGDGTIVARVVSLAETSEWAKAGVMIRDTPEPDSAHAFVCVTPKNSACFQRRREAGADSTTSGPGGQIKAPYWVKLTRTGDLFAAAISADGKEWQPIGEDTIRMGKDVLIGLAVTSHDNGKVTESVIDNVTVTR